jgi:hypothetical protein
MDDFRGFIGTDIGHGIFIWQYLVENSDYILTVGTGGMDNIFYALLTHATDGGANDSIDIRYYDVDKFIADGIIELVRPLPEPQETLPLNASISEAVTPITQTESLRNTLIRTAIIQHNNGMFYEPDGVYPTESHVILALEENLQGFTAYVMSLYMSFLPDGEFGVKEVSGQHIPLALTFDKNQNGDYELTEYWTAEDGSHFIPSIRSKFPENIWGLVDTQLYIHSSKQDCYNQAIYHFYGIILNSSIGGD